MIHLSHTPLGITLVVAVLWALAAVHIAVADCRANNEQFGIATYQAAAIACAIAIIATLTAPAERALPLGVLFGSLAVLTWTDLRFGLLFDTLTYSTFGVILVASAGSAASLESALLGALVIASPLAAVHFGYKLFGGRGMGLGDAKLALAIGAAFGLRNASVALCCAFFIAGLVGVVLVLLRKGRKYTVPFGPYLGAGALLTLLFGNTMLQLVSAW